MSLDPDAGLLELVAGSARAIGEVAAGLASEAGPTAFGEASLAADPAAALPGAPESGTVLSAKLGEGLTGTSLLVLGPEATARLGGGQSLEASAGRLMAEVAGVATRLLGAPVDVGTCAVRSVGSIAETEAAFGGVSGQVAFVDLSVGGDPCRFVTVVPQTAAVRLRGALAERGATDWSASSGVLDVSAQGTMRDSLRTTRVRVSAEVGRTRLPVESLVGVPAGTVIELDRDADDPIDVYVNGRHFAIGRLVLTETAEWAVRIETVL